MPTQHLQLPLQATLGLKASDRRPSPVHTDRADWNRQQLAENVWLVSLGCSGGAQRACGDHLHLIQHGFQENPFFEKLADFPYVHVEIG